jgi:hypothetical protein
VDKARNDLSAAVPKFCLALEEHRRTPDGRVRTSQELLATFFPHDDKACTDRILKHLPSEVRGPIIAAWGIRGVKAALRDNDEKVQSVLYDALLAGDVDHAAFEDGLTAETLVRWVPLGDLWTFWRGGKLTKQAIHKALATAYELFLFDARWFLETVSARNGALKGTDVLSDGLSKDDLTQWVRRIHETGDGSPKGIVAALGWDKIVAKTPNDVLVAALDAVAIKVGLVAAAAKDSQKLLDAGAKIEAKPEVKAEGKAEPAPAAAEPPPAAAAKANPATATAPKSADASGSLPKVEIKPAEPFPAAAPDKGGAKEVAVAGARPEEPTWSEPPPALPNESTGAAGEELIHVVVDEELLTSAQAAGAKPVGKSTYEEDEQTMIKAFPSRPPPPASPERPPFRSPPRR